MYFVFFSNTVLIVFKCKEVNKSFYYYILYTPQKNSLAFFNQLTSDNFCYGLAYCYESYCKNLKQNWSLIQKYAVWLKDSQKLSKMFILYDGPPSLPSKNWFCPPYMRLTLGVPCVWAVHFHISRYRWTSLSAVFLSADSLIYKCKIVLKGQIFSQNVSIFEFSISGSK